MLAEFKENLSSLIGNESFETAGKRPGILAAVSGGIDSMVMASLLYECNYKNFAIASVNFKLRGQDSDADQNLVCNWAKEHDIKFFNVSFDTISYAYKEGISIEMAARDLRYKWFYKVMDDEEYDFLAIAHNMNDSVETLFLNIIRGTGIDGVTGIREKRERIIRPLLRFSRAEILKYAQDGSVPYRNDKTNSENIYSRNRIRNNIFPEFQKINPSFLRTICRDMEYFKEAGDIIKDQYKRIRARVLEECDSQSKINISLLIFETHCRYWLYMLLDEYGFNSSQCDQVYDSFYGQPGKRFFSPKYMLVKDREFLLLFPRGDVKMDDGGNKAENYMIYRPENGVEMVGLYGCSFYVKLYMRTSDFRPIPSKETLFMDASKVEFPLTCRPWKDGDRFIPLGMSRFKKLSDFFTDNKLDIKSKEHQLVLSAGNDIICILGQRIDDRYKITPETVEVLEVKIN